MIEAREDSVPRVRPPALNYVLTTLMLGCNVRQRCVVQRVDKYGKQNIKCVLHTV